jgi:hypothetical protein
MTPKDLSYALIDIANRIDRSSNPSRTLVANDLRGILNRVASAEHEAISKGDIVGAAALTAIVGALGLAGREQDVSDNFETLSEIMAHPQNHDLKNHESALAKNTLSAILFKSQEQKAHGALMDCANKMKMELQGPIQPKDFLYCGAGYLAKQGIELQGVDPQTGFGIVGDGKLFNPHTGAMEIR